MLNRFIRHSELFTKGSARQRWLGYAWGIAAPLICTAVDWPLRNWLGPASILMTYLLGVFLVASHFGRGPSIVASVLSAPVFAFYFAKPIFSVAIHDLENIVGLGVMIVVANVTGSLLEKSRHQTALATQREALAGALYRLSQALLTVSDSADAASIAVSHLHDELGVDAVLIGLDGKEGLAESVVDLPALNMARAKEAFDSRSAMGERGVSYYPLNGSKTCQGVLAIKLDHTDSSELSAFLDTFCHLIAQTIERLQFAAQAREAKLAADTEALRNALLSSISHDLRTPLTRIVGAVGDLIDNDAGITEGERLEVCQLVMDEAQRMSELTGKLLDMARLSSGEIIMHRDWNAIEEIVGSALNRLEKQLRERPVRTLLPDDLPLLWIDAVLMEQVLVNLIENAAKYSPASSPIDISSQIENGCCLLRVADYGAGVPCGQEQKIFEKFHRAVPETDQSGVGLGLALCKSIVEAHDGTIDVRNRVGKGAEFTLSLPLREPPALSATEIQSGEL